MIVNFVINGQIVQSNDEDFIPEVGERITLVEKEKRVFLVVKEIEKILIREGDSVDTHINIYVNQP